MWSAASALFRLRLMPGRMRPAVLRAFGATVGSGIVIESDVRVSRPWLVRLDGPAWIGEGTRIEHRGPVVVERDACLAPRARIGSDRPDTAPITVGAGAWVGPEAQVLGGVKIGRNAVLAEGAVATDAVDAGRTVTARDAG